MSEKAVFLDRDNTLIHDPGYINDPDQVKLIEGAPEALVELKAMGYKLVVVTNQSGVARGIVTEKVLGKIHDRLRHLLAEKGASLDRIYYCPYHTDGVIEKYRKQSDWRKPNPGMLLAAAEEMDIDLSESWMVGNGYDDVEAGARAGCKTILINQPPSRRSPEPAPVKADYSAVNIKEAVNIIKKHLRSSRLQPEQTKPAEMPETLPQPQTVQPESMKAQTAQTEETQSQTQTVGILKENERQAEPEAPAKKNNNPTTEQLLGQILQQLKSSARSDMFSEFSIMRLLAGLVQILAVTSLAAAGWFLLAPKTQASSVFIALGFAAVLQVMALTFYMMQGRR